LIFHRDLLHSESKSLLTKKMGTRNSSNIRARTELTTVFGPGFDDPHSRLRPLVITGPGKLRPARSMQRMRITIRHELVKAHVIEDSKTPIK
jgi:hypothetical protein